MNVYTVHMQSGRVNRQSVVVSADNQKQAAELAQSLVKDASLKVVRVTRRKMLHHADAIWLTSLLARAGKTQKQFAAECGIHLSQVSRWCCGRVKMGRNHFDRIAKLLA
jgi:hypothetical protein